MFTYQPQPADFDRRPEKKDEVFGRLERILHSGVGKFQKWLPAGGKINSLVAKIEALSDSYQKLNRDDLDAACANQRKALLCDGLTTANVVKSFALVREYSGRVLQMRHYESQIKGGLILLQGRIAEMETGEGKTLTATLPAATMAFAGVPVHVISVNDYLTERDMQNMGPLYRAMGISTGCVIHGVDPGERRRQYLSDITYVTNKELVFDYLRDRLILGDRSNPLLLQNEYIHSHGHRSKRVLLRGLHYGIVDEADSILIDEARTPLIISSSQERLEKRQFFEQALALAHSLEEDEHYVIDRAVKRLRLTPKGKKLLEEKAPSLGPLWNGMVRRESTVQQALTALYFFEKDEQYLIRDGKIQIIDEFTGRIMADRSWEQGLHQLIEIKEGCELTDEREPLAKISYQRFFRRYLRLSGMTGTAKEVTDELWTVYNLRNIRIPPHRPIQRKQLAMVVLADQPRKWELVVKRIEAIHQEGRPVLVGTRSVAASEKLSQYVARAGIEHQVLNAKQDAEEASIISRAGQRGMVTIATNMAGRGTDIILGPEVRELGGLHVIGTELHEAARIDRQLAGRCGRQGDPGSYEFILSFEDILFEGRESRFLVRFGRLLATRFPVGGIVVTSRIMKFYQNRIERYHAKVRKNLFRQDQARGNLLSFAGRVE